MASPNNKSDELYQPVPPGTLVFSVWEDASEQDVVLAPSVGPALSPQVVSSSTMFLFELSLTSCSRFTTMCTLHSLCQVLLSTLPQTDLQGQLQTLD